jgi:hypothetical protein
METCMYNDTIIIPQENTVVLHAWEFVPQAGCSTCAQPEQNPHPHP